MSLFEKLNIFNLFHKKKFLKKKVIIVIEKNPLEGYKEKLEKAKKNLAGIIYPDQVEHINTNIDKLIFSFGEIDKELPREKEIRKILSDLDKKILNTEKVAVKEVRLEIRKLKREKSEINQRIKKHITEIKYLLDRIKAHSLTAFEETLPIVENYIYMDNEWIKGTAE